MTNRGDQVVERDPTPELPSRSHSATESEFEGEQHLLQCPPLLGENHPDAEIDHPDTRLASRLGFGFPIATQVTEKHVARLVGLLDPVVAAIAVKADR